MSLVNNIDKNFKDKIAQDYAGLIINNNGVFINLGGLNIPLLDKDCKVVDNRLSELSEPIRRELSGQYTNSPSLMQAFVSRAQKEIDSFLTQVARGFIDTLKAKLASEKKILGVYENRKMIDFLQDNSFQTKVPNKESELDNYTAQYGINSFGQYNDDAEIFALVTEFSDCKKRYQALNLSFRSFLVIMKGMMDLTKKVENTKNANSELKANALKNLNLVNEITYEDMKSIPFFTSNIDIELQKKLLTTVLTKNELLSALISSN